MPFLILGKLLKPFLPISQSIAHFRLELVINFNTHFGLQIAQKDAFLAVLSFSVFLSRIRLLYRWLSLCPRLFCPFGSSDNCDEPVNF